MNILIWLFVIPFAIIIYILIGILTLYVICKLIGDTIYDWVVDSDDLCWVGIISFWPIIIVVGIIFSPFFIIEYIIESIYKMNQEVKSVESYTITPKTTTVRITPKTDKNSIPMCINCSYCIGHNESYCFNGKHATRVKSTDVCSNFKLYRR